MPKCFITDLEVDFIENDEDRIEYLLEINKHSFHLLFDLNTNLGTELSIKQKHACTCMLWNDDWPIYQEYTLTKTLIERALRFYEYPQDFNSKLDYFIRQCYVTGGKERIPISADLKNYYKAFADDEKEYKRIVESAVDNRWIYLENEGTIILMTPEGKTYCESIADIDDEPDIPGRDRPLERVRLSIVYCEEDDEMGKKVHKLVTKWGAGISGGVQGIKNDVHDYYNTVTSINSSNFVLIIKTANSDNIGIWRDILSYLVSEEKKFQRKLFYVLIGDDSSCDDNPHLHDRINSQMIDFRIIPKRNKLLEKIQDAVAPGPVDFGNSEDEENTWSTADDEINERSPNQPQNQFNGDTAIFSKKEDKFQRYHFANRISKTILGRTSTDNLTIAIYGAWGEGKTSVLNFIKGDLDEYLGAFGQLEKHEKPFVQIDFIPWRFDQEDALLISFFNQLAVALDGPPKKSIFGRRLPLDSKRDSFGKFIKKYADHIPSIQGVPIGSVAKGIGAFLGNAEVDNYKEKINRKLIESNKKIVIYIDDIDRLDKKEILSLFRLIKLTANFSNLIYVLAFDDAVIGQVLGENYGETENQQTGSAFLEKIVQVPLRLPRAPEKHLENYFLEQVKVAFDANGITFNEEDIKEFYGLLFRNGLFKLETPRAAIRYSNAISFSLPLVFNEVNLSDFLTIEALRVFYPEVHAFVRQNSNLFLGAEHIGHTGKEVGDDVRKKEFGELFEPVYDTYDETHKKTIRRMLTFLFQVLKHTWWGDYTVYHNRMHNIQQNKRISSKYYFDKYFTYCVLNDDIPDIAITNVLDEIMKGYSEGTVTVASNFIDAYDPDTFLRKLRAKGSEFTSDQATSIVKTLSLLGSRFDIQKFVIFRFTATVIQAAEFIAGLIKNNVKESERYSLLEWVLERAEPFWFSFEIYLECFGKRKNNQYIDRMLSTEQYDKIFQKYTLRLFNIHPEIPLFVSDPSGTKEVFTHWADVGKDQLHEYIKRYVEKDVAFILPLVKMFTTHQKTIGDGGSETPYISDFKEMDYDYLSIVLEVDYIYQKVLDYLKKPNDYKAKFILLNRNQTDENILEQFMFHHQKYLNV